MASVFLLHNLKGPCLAIFSEEGNSSSTVSSHYSQVSNARLLESHCFQGKRMLQVSGYCHYIVHYLGHVGKDFEGNEINVS